MLEDDQRRRKGNFVGRIKMGLKKNRIISDAASLNFEVN